MTRDQMRMELNADATEDRLALFNKLMDVVEVARKALIHISHPRHGEALENALRALDLTDNNS